jgi:hypothetical protein
MGVNHVLEHDLLKFKLRHYRSASDKLLPPIHLSAVILTSRRTKVPILGVRMTMKSALALRFFIAVTAALIATSCSNDTEQRDFDPTEQRSQSNAPILPAQIGIASLEPLAIAAPAAPNPEILAAVDDFIANRLTVISQPRWYQYTADTPGIAIPHMVDEVLRETHDRLSAETLQREGRYFYFRVWRRRGTQDGWLIVDGARNGDLPIIAYQVRFDRGWEPQTPDQLMPY